MPTRRETQAKSEETNKQNVAQRAVDGKLNTRWCASNAAPQQWWQVNLGEPRTVRGIRIHWEMANAAYRYQVFGSSAKQPPVDDKDGAWELLVDASENKRRGQVVSHTVEAQARWLRVRFLGSSTGSWGSIREFSAYKEKLPELPEPTLDGQNGGATTATIGDVQAPSEFDVSLFAAPPLVNYPVCLTAAPDGVVFVGVDEQGSLGKKPGGGRIMRCIDADGDGRAERINEFAKVDHPRGLIYDHHQLWVLHPPMLTRFTDDDRDGVAERRETLIEGISTDEVNRRGADHTTNGIRMGIDGWIYIAVGDFGFSRAKAKDGTVLSRRGGGIVRIRPDGANMEIYAWGLRNILDVCIDPYMNIFTRDNTNDGGGWNVRLSHILQTAHYGYPSLYTNFADEIMPTLADYGGGSGCGGMYFHDQRWPVEFRDALYTCDWGRSEVYRHRLPANGATFNAHQALFAKLPRPTDIDVDASGRMYISSWKNGSFNFKGVDVGFVAQVTPRSLVPRPFPVLSSATTPELIQWLSSPSAAYRLHSQREVLRRGAGQRGKAGGDLVGLLNAHAADASLRAVAFDPDSVTTKGTPVSIVEGVLQRVDQQLLRNVGQLVSPIREGPQGEFSEVDVMRQTSKQRIRLGARPREETAPRLGLVGVDVEDMTWPYGIATLVDRVELDPAGDQRGDGIEIERQALAAERNREAGRVPEPRRGVEPPVVRRFDEGVDDDRVGREREARALQFSDLDTVKEDRRTLGDEPSIGGEQADAGAVAAGLGERRPVGAFERIALCPRLVVPGAFDIDAGEHGREARDAARTDLGADDPELRVLVEERGHFLVDPGADEDFRQVGREADILDLADHHVAVAQCCLAGGHAKRALKLYLDGDAALGEALPGKPQRHDERQDGHQPDE